MAEVNNFDVLKEMCARNMDIRLAPMSSNLLTANYSKRGTRVEVGVPGNVVGDLLDGKLNGCLLLWDHKQYQEIKTELEKK